MYIVQLTKTQVLAHHLIFISIAYIGEISEPKTKLYKNVFFLKHRMKHFASDEISAQVSSLLSRSEMKHCRAGIVTAR